MTTGVDVVELAQRLIRRRSVTPEDDGALDVLADALTGLGFTCRRVTFSDADTPDIPNLYARWGTGRPNIAFAGHTDVVPVGDPADWSVDPFGGAIVGDELVGRGAVDMKGAIAAFVAAAAQVIDGRDPASASISFVITGDEEGPSINGTRKLLGWLAEQGERVDMAIVGEPTSGDVLGDTIKVGRRGSLNATLTATGRQGHTAYPQHAANPVHPLVHALNGMITTPMDQGSAHFEPSTLQVTSIDVGNSATNVIPARAQAKLNVRFNDHHDSASVRAFLDEHIRNAGGNIALAMRVSGESFLSPPGPLTDALAGAVADTLGRAPALGTGGGTSDARFIKDVCPVAELGLKNATAHQVDERAPLADLRDLSEVCRVALNRLLES
jgi:succinyl-diaminopimelate desuccinylase